MKSYKAVWIWGQIDLSRKGESGHLEIGDDGFALSGKETQEVHYRDVKTIELRKTQLGTTVIVETPGGQLQIVVPRINFGGQFVIVNLSATRSLLRELTDHWQRSTKRL